MCPFETYFPREHENMWIQHRAYLSCSSEKRVCFSSSLKWISLLTFFVLINSTEFDLPENKRLFLRGKSAKGRNSLLLSSFSSISENRGVNKTLRSLQPNNTELVVNVNPAFTLIFTLFDKIPFFADGSLRTITDEVKDSLHECLSKTENDPQNLSSAYDTLLLIYSKQTVLPSSPQEDQNIVAIAVTFSTVITFDITTQIKDQSNLEQFRESSVIENWLVRNYRTCIETPGLAENLRESGQEELRSLDTVDLTSLRDTLDSSNGTNTKKSGPNMKAIIGAIVGCILAGALSAYVMLFGFSSSKKNENSNNPNYSKQTMQELGLNKGNKNEVSSRSSSKKKSSDPDGERSRHSNRSNGSSRHSHEKKYDENGRRIRDHEHSSGYRRHHHRRHHKSSGSRSSRSSSSRGNGNGNGRKRRRRKKKKHLDRSTYTMSSISSGSLMTISEDDHNINFSEDERDSAGNRRLDIAFQSHQLQKVEPGSPPNIPNEITLNATDLYNFEELEDPSKKIANRQNENPILSYFFRTEIYNQDPQSNEVIKEKEPQNNMSTVARMRGFSSSNSSLGASQYGYDSDGRPYDKKRERILNMQRKQPITGAEIPPHPRRSGEMSDNDSDIYSMEKSPPRLPWSQKKLVSQLSSPQINGHKPQDSSTSMKPPLSPHRIPSSSSLPENKEELTVVAPKGKIGVFIIVVTRGEPCVVHSVKKDSSIYGKLFVGDIVTKIDGIDVRK